jgi:transposase
MREGIMARVNSWEVSDSFWGKVEQFIPKPERVAGKQYSRKTGGGRKPKDKRLIFEGIVYVLRTGCQWKALPRNVMEAQALSTNTLSIGPILGYFFAYGKPV